MQATWRHDVVDGDLAKGMPTIDALDLPGDTDDDDASGSRRSAIFTMRSTTAWKARKNGYDSMGYGEWSEISSLHEDGYEATASS